MGTSITKVRTRYDVFEKSHGESASKRRTKGFGRLAKVFLPVHAKLSVEDDFPCLPNVLI
jgi:hypothetical protein